MGWEWDGRDGELSFTSFKLLNSSQRKDGQELLSPFTGRESEVWLGNYIIQGHRATKSLFLSPGESGEDRNVTVPSPGDLFFFFFK